MLRSIKQLYGDKLGASDGEIGHVKDFYFDDQNWVIRYLVVDTGSWLSSRKVLLTPHSLGRLEQQDKILKVNLTRKQIEDSPSIDSHKPVSRQFEEEYYKHYGWPYYWQGDGLWGMSGFPILEMPDAPAAGQSASPSSVAGPESADAHLRSTRDVAGYQVRTGETGMGHICDFMMDAETWEIGQLAVKIGHRFSGEEILIPTKQVERISYDDSTVLIHLTGADLNKSAERQVTPIGTVL